MMKKFLAIILALIMVVGTAACGAKPAANDPTAGSNPLDVNGDGKVIFGVEIQTETSDWHATFAADNEKFFKEECGADEVLISSSEMDVNKGIADLQAFQAAGCDGVVMIPDSAVAAADIIKELTESGMFVATNASLEEIPDQTVGGVFDHYTFGYNIGEAAGKWLAENGYNVAETQIATSHYALSKQDLVDRYDGMIKGITDNAPNVTIVADYTSADAAAESSNIETALTTYPELRAWVSLWDGLASLEVVKTMGYNSKDFGLFCGEQSQEMADALANPENVALKGFAIMTAGERYENNTIYARELVKAMRGEEYSNPAVVIPGGYCTIENVYEIWPDTKVY